MARTQQTGEVATLQQHNVSVTNSFADDLESYTPNIRDALPAHIPVERFKRVVVTAVSQNPDLLYANRRTLFTACQRCAVDGLLPDGREAALVVYNTRVKQRDPETGLDKEVRMDVVQYMPMISGIRKRLRNTGDVDSAVAESVHEKDRFRYRLGDEAFIEHEPPALGEDRGPVIGAYAIIRLRNGEVIRDVMDRATIEKSRGQSRAKDSLMWTAFYHEAAKKTVLRRAAKQAPFSPDIERLLLRDEEPALAEHREQEQEDRIPVVGHREDREPQRPLMMVDTPQDTGPQFAVVDLDGVEHVYQAGARACDALRTVMAEAERRGPGPAQLDGFWESNQPAVELLNSTGFGQEAIDLAIEYANARQRAARPAENAAATAAGRPDPGAASHAAAPEAAQTRETPAATVGAQEPEPAASAPPLAAAVPAAAGPGPERPPTAAAAPAASAPAAISTGGSPGPSYTGDRPDMTIPPVLKKNNQFDGRTWVVALFLPKLRRQRASDTLAFLMGDNEKTLAEAKTYLSKDELQELEQAIRDQWKLVENQTPTCCSN